MCSPIEGKTTYPSLRNIFAYHLCTHVSHCVAYYIVIQCMTMLRVKVCLRSLINQQLRRQITIQWFSKYWGGKESAQSTIITLTTQTLRATWCSCSDGDCMFYHLIFCSCNGVPRNSPAYVHFLFSCAICSMLASLLGCWFFHTDTPPPPKKKWTQNLDKRSKRSPHLGWNTGQRVTYGLIVVRFVSSRTVNFAMTIVFF